MDRFSWLPTECAPVDHPIQILQGDLLFEDGDSIYIPDNRLVYNGWGEIGSVHIVGDELKPVPGKLSITWFSFLEDKFYGGDFLLPADKISRLFVEGYVSAVDNKQATYNYIMVGLAPGGGVAVWLRGEQITREVCFLKASPASIGWTDFFDHPTVTRKQFIDLNLAQILTTEELALSQNRKVPADKWEKLYRNSFAWQPLLAGAGSFKIWMEYFNGEREFVDSEREEKNTVVKRPVPHKLTLNWKNLQEQSSSAGIYLDEKEIFQAFSKFTGENEEGLQLQIQVSSINKSVKLYLRNRKYLLELMRSRIRLY